MGEQASFRVETVTLDLPALVGAFSRRLHDAGLPSEPERAAHFAQALTLVRPVSRRRLYWVARAVFVSDPGQLRRFDAVFAEVFGRSAATETGRPDVARRIDLPPDDRPEADSGDLRDVAPPSPAASISASARDTSSQDLSLELPVPIAPSDEEVLRGKRFDALEPGELALLYRLMGRLQIATPLRRARRARRDHHGDRIDLRRTLRGGLRTGGDPVRIARRRRRIVPRRMVLLCDISGSMEPYARAYVQFLTSAAGSGPRVETFVFATRLTRLTRALAGRYPERAIERAVAAAPDWSSGTRIGEALKAFNDRHGRRGMARGAVIVILSDGWERGDPTLVGREMERLARLAHRILWVNPRAGAAGFSPRVGGMAAALPYCDALLSGDSLSALEDVVEAIGAPRRTTAGRVAPSAAADEPDEEPWPSATPVAGSSVAMPSGYGPSRGRTTPGWGLGGR